MKRFNLSITVLLLQFSFSIFAADELENKLRQIKKDYQIPGLAVFIASSDEEGSLNVLEERYLGVLSLESKAPVTSSSLFPIASLSKAFSSYLITAQINQNMISLEDDIHKFLKDSDVNKDVTLRQLLSHKMVGKSDNPFFYDPRFSYLTNIIENISQQSYQPFLGKQLAQDFGKNLLSQYTTSLNDNTNLATGHTYNGELVSIPHEFGVSASAGLVASPRAIAHAGTTLLKTYAQRENKRHIFDLLSPEYEYSNGFFHQTLASHKILWSYGQYDGYGALWIIVPERRLQMVVLANSNIISDASRLIFGDINSSPFAELLLDQLLCDVSECDTSATHQRASLLRDVDFSRYNEQQYLAAVKKLETISENILLLENFEPLHLLHSLNYLKTVSSKLNYPPPNVDRLVKIILKSSPARMTKNPYWLYYDGALHLADGDLQKAYTSLNRLVNLHNMPKHWTVIEAQLMLNKLELQK